MGHILGGTFMALTPTIERGVLNVGGASFGLILTRSNAFRVFELILEQWFDRMNLLKFEAMATTPLEVIDPIAFAPLVQGDPLLGASPHQILMQIGIGDTAVPNVAGELHARAMGLELVTPAPQEVPFLDEVAAPAPSGLVMFDFGIEDVADNWEPVTEMTAPHEGVRRFGPAREQTDRFLRPDGVIENTCAGPCVVNE
jgi:hypothetical protein